MAAAETVFEYLAAAREATKGTAVTPPTHYFPFSGMITPVREKYRTRDSNGTLAGVTRSKTVRNFAEWSGDGGADPNLAPFMFNLVTRGSVTSPSTPTNGVLTRLWTFTPAQTSDVLDSATIFWGDPNVQIFRSTYCMAEEMTIEAGTSGTDAATWSVNGFGRFPSRVSAPSLPAQITGDLLMPSAMQMWIDTSSAIGTTEVTGRFISTSWTIPTGVTRKHYAGGPTGGLDFTKHGRTTRTPVATITVELNETSINTGKEYLTYEADTLVKMRIRINGSLIESVTPDYYSYIQLDIYGPLSDLSWGDVEGSNRTLTLQVHGQYDATAATDYVLYAQNARTTL